MKSPTAILEPNPVYPALSDRIQSSFIDALIIISLMFVFASVLDRYENTPEWVRIALFVFIWVLYEPVCMSLGCTPGNYVKQIRVRRISDQGKRLNIFQALIRFVVKCLLGWISFLTMHFNEERRAMHDFAAGSIVLKV